MPAKSMLPPVICRNPLGITKSGVTTPRAAKPSVAIKIWRPEALQVGRFAGNVKVRVGAGPLLVSTRPSQPASPESQSDLPVSLTVMNCTEPSPFEKTWSMTDSGEAACALAMAAASNNAHDRISFCKAWLPRVTTRDCNRASAAAARVCDEWCGIRAGLGTLLVLALD